MLPPLKTVKAGLHRATEALAQELAQPGTATPGWDDLEWRLASAAAVAHGISPMLSGRCRWRHAPWQRFLRQQRAHVASRQRRIEAMLERIDANARGAGLAVVALKGTALHAVGLYAPGELPMADIDLLVRESDAGTAAAMLQSLGHVESYAQWKHLVFKPTNGHPVPGLGEHRDTPINIELHVRIQERLPVSIADITGQVFPRNAHPGLNGYASTGALMSHLLLHAAGSICNRSLRLMHLHDIALLSARMTADDWRALDGDPVDARCARIDGASRRARRTDLSCARHARGSALPGAQGHRQGRASGFRRAQDAERGAPALGFAWQYSLIQPGDGRAQRGCVPWPARLHPRAI